MTPAELAERFYLRSVALLVRHELLRIALDPRWRRA
jgi:hypothetical protein